MIAEHCAGRAGLAHFSRNPQDFSLIGAAINEVTNKYYFSAVVPECAVDFTIAKFNQQSAQRVRMAMDIADQVITLFSHGFRRRFSVIACAVCPHIQTHARFLRFRREATKPKAEYNPSVVE